MRRLKRFAVFLSIVFFAVLSAGLVVYIPIYQEAVDDASNIERKLIVRNENPTVIVSADRKANGDPYYLYTAAAIRRKVVDLADLPPYVGYAFVAAEDRRFYDHQGVDPVGLARVLFTAARDRRIGQGGSTISMQIAKLMVNGDARTPLRKLKDIATAQQIESLKSKREILNLYVNYAYFGEHAYGLQRAAQIYFGKDAKELTVGEAAMLARSVRLPGRVNPIKSPEKMIDLRDYVLKVMKEEGWITQSQYDEGIHETPKVVHGRSNGLTHTAPGAGYFVQHVFAQLEQKFPGVDFRAGGYRIETTLNYKLQLRAVDAVKRVLAENRGNRVNDGAIVIMDQFGRILAEVGGPDYDKREFNVVTQGRRQPGSAFKAIVYATALKTDRIHPGSYLSNARIHLKVGRNKYWDPENASRRENLPGYTLEDAFTLSVNRPAIHVNMDVGPSNVVALARDSFGIKSPLDAVPALALGTSSVKPLEMLEAYSVFMLGGNRAEPMAITRVYRSVGDTYELAAPEYQPTVHQGALEPRVAQQMDEILKGPIWSHGTATYARVIPNSRGKTGTTNDHKDAWFCGYADGLVAVGWTGNTSKKGLPLEMGSSVFGGTVTVKIWTEVMQAARNLGLAKGLVGKPNTSVTVQASPDEPVVPPVRERRDDEAVPPVDPAIEALPAEPPVVDPKPDDTEPPVDENADPEKQAPPVEEPKPRAEAPKPRVEKRRDPPKAADSQEVSVEVCVDTGMRASTYCPETVTRQFAKGRAPRKVCTLHPGAGTGG